MSEDEILDKVNYMINNWHRSVVEIRIEWIQGLLDLYQKEKEKNKKFFNGEIFTRKQIKIVQKAIKEGLEEQLPKEMKDFISKDKIKEKIKELEGQEDWYIENKGLDELYGRIDMLKELLEEEE